MNIIEYTRMLLKYNIILLAILIMVIRQLWFNVLSGFLQCLNFM